MKLHELPSGRRVPNEIYVVVEVPYGHRNKYEYDSDLGAIVLDRPLFSPVHYPGDYGFVPGTLAEDGDPLDVLVLVKTPTFPGCVVAARPLGVLMMKDEKGSDEKLLAVPVTDPTFETYHSLSDVPPHFLHGDSIILPVPRHLGHVVRNVKNPCDCCTCPFPPQ